MIVLLLVYAAAFILLVIRGRNRDFDQIVALRYADDDALNRFCSVVFAPLYILASCGNHSH